MGLAKLIQIKPISSVDANRLVKRLHYSGKIVNNSVLHLGVFLNERLEGAMQFGSPLDKRKVLPLVAETEWHGMLELNRMAFSDRLPKNSESRALGIAFRIIRAKYPQIEWVLSFADGTQSGDGTIYRASGFSLIGVKRNTSLRKDPVSGAIMQDMQAFHLGILQKFKTWPKLTGYMCRYIYFINKQARARLTVPILPFSKIDEMGAGMYKGQKRTKQAMAETIGTAAEHHRPVRSITY